MNRSLMLQRLVATGPAPAGTVVVPDTFGHPERGPVRCDAAALVRSRVAVGGVPAVADGVRTVNDTGIAGPGDTVLFAATYLDPKRGTVGFGAAASLADVRAARAAREAVAAYAAALRTRQVIVADAGPTCGCLMPDAAGACPAVPKALDAVRRFADRGDTVVVIGSLAKATVRRLVAQAPARTVPVVDVDGVRALDVADPSAVAYVPAPGMTFAQTAPVVEALRSRFGRIPLQSPEDYCPAASEQSAMLAALAAACDTVLLLGPGASMADGFGDRIVPVQTLAALTPEVLAPALTLGLATVGGPEAGSPALTPDVLRAVSGLGPTAVRRMRVTSALARIPAATA